MKTLKGIFLTATILCLAGAGWAQGQRQDKTPRIILEEEEVTLFDDSGKELEKRYVSKMGEEKRAILNQVKARVRGKLGVKSEQEVQAKMLWRESKKENEKLIKIQELKQPRLKFTDKDGRIVKELKLRNITERRRVPSRTSDESIEVSSENIQVAILSDSGTVAGIIGMDTVNAWDSRISSTMTFEYFNANGEKQWSIDDIKPWVNSDPRRGAILSADGKRVALAIAQLPSNADIELYPNWVVVYDGDGKELVRFGPYDLLRNLYLSKNGKYGYFTIGEAQVCFDVDNKVLHKFPDERGNPKLTGVIRVSEEGRCTINSYMGALEFDAQGEQKTKVVREFSFTNK